MIHHRAQAMRRLLPLAGVVSLVACGPDTALRPSVTAPTPPPALAEAPVPTPGARVRIANIGSYDLDGLRVVLPAEEIRIGDVRSNSLSDYVATTHGAYDGVGFIFFGGDVIFGPYPPFGPRPLPSPLGGHAFTYYLVLEVDPLQGPVIRTIRITRDE